MKKYLFIFLSVLFTITSLVSHAQTRTGGYKPSKFDTIKKVVPPQVYGNAKSRARLDSLNRIRIQDSIRIAKEKEDARKLEEERVRKELEEKKARNNNNSKEQKKKGNDTPKETIRSKKEIEREQKLAELKAEQEALEEAQRKKSKGLPEIWTLEDCVNYAKQNNLKVSEGELNERMARLMLQQAQYSRLPNVNADMNVGESYGRAIDPTSNQFVTKGFLYNTVGISSQALLFGCFQKKHQIEQNDIELSASQYAFKQLKEDIALNVATGYLRVLLAREQVKVTEAQLKLDKEQYQQTVKFANAGKVPELNVAQMAAQLSSDSASIVSAQSEERIALIQLRALMNFDLNQKFEVASPKLDIDKISSMYLMPNPEEIYNTAIENQNQMKYNELKLLSAKKSLDIAKTTQYPQLFLFSNIGTNFSSNVKDIVGQTYKGESPIGNVNVAGTSYPITIPQYNFETRTRPWLTQFGDNVRANVGLSLTIPILNGYTARTNIQRARLGLVSQQIAMDNDKLKLKQDILIAYEQAKAASQKYNATLRSQEASSRALNFAVKRYEIGMISPFEYMSSLNTLNQNNSNVLSSKYDLIFKLKVLDYYMGNPLKL